MKKSRDIAKEKKSAYDKRHRIKNKEKKAAYDKEYKNKHKEELTAYLRKYYSANKKVLLVKQKKYRAKHKEKCSKLLRIWWLKHNYGLTLIHYDEILKNQGGVCKICGNLNTDSKYLAVDHDHKTGKVRGLLCGNCNRAIGLLNDNPTLLLKTAKYLKR